MNLKQTIKVLEQHNRWRRDKNVPAKTEMPDPKVLGLAIDRAIEELNKILEAKVVVQNEQSCKYADSCDMGYYHQIGDYYCSKCQKTGLAKLPTTDECMARCLRRNLR